MKCIYCLQPVFGASGMTVSPLGAAHIACFNNHSVQLRIFKGLTLSDLSDNEITDLHDLLLAEKNSRCKLISDLVELF